MTVLSGRAATASSHPFREGTGLRARDRLRARRAGRPRWERPAFWALLAVTAGLYLWHLGASGYANSFYSAAAQAGGADGKAFLFGSLDAGNAITVDKPPAALWPMALSVRLFGLGHWQILVPQALMGVASVGVLFGAVRRRTGPVAGLLAGALLALTPVAALMFRFNNPDALLCLLLVCALYFLERALEDARARWLVLAGACFGCAFLVKTLQAWLILPVAALVYLACGPGRMARRVGGLLLGGLAALVTAGWWVALVELWPASSRPYIGGSQTNSFLELTLGYNGLGRITGDETGSVGGGGGPGGGGGWGDTGLTRLFGAETGGQISWLLPAALLLLVAGLVLTRGAPRTDPQRGSLLLWGGSLLLTGGVFSFMSGIFHAYYTVALAPYVAAVTAMGGVLLWRSRDRARWCLPVLAVAVAGTAAWAAVLLARSPEWLPWLRRAVVVAGVLAACGLLLSGWRSRRLPRWFGAGAVLTGLLTAVAGPVAYTLDTVGTPKSGSIVSAGPAVGGGPGGGPAAPPGGGPGTRQGRAAEGHRATGPGAPVGPQTPGTRQGLPARGGPSPDGTPRGRPQQGRAPRGAGVPPGGSGGGEARRGPDGAGGGMRGLLNGTEVSARATALLRRDAARYTWAAATVGSQNAASHQLATGEPVMAVGGFNGSDPSPTPAQFRRYVAQGRIHYFLAGGGAGGPGGNRGTAAEITTWVERHFTPVRAGDATFYDLTKPKSSS
ncbi:glycosyltransferase family 39 protein [Streptomyces cacaoi]|uniref:Glycosyl transferase n=2 Tax=Streptomyces cacaoi TaxID=1898 RepID=A0A4Y3R9J9_STRCI|nr:glycosyltransferase family 39 protein [Streptomyces cacaoi]GEB52490.1 glycosyl transferase [Streptomyces cacaoi]